MSGFMGRHIVTQSRYVCFSILYLQRKFDRIIYYLVFASSRQQLLHLTEKKGPKAQESFFLANIPWPCTNKAHSDVTENSLYQSMIEICVTVPITSFLPRHSFVGRRRCNVTLFLIVKFLFTSIQCIFASMLLNICTIQKSLLRSRFILKRNAMISTVWSNIYTKLETPG